jgi:peptide/nickel transport system substrate-binding protein
MGHKRHTTVTRRDFLKVGSAIATGAALGVALPWTAPARVAAAAGVLRIGIPSDIQQIDPHLVSSAIDYTSMEAMAESLTTFDRDMNPVPSLAEKWEQPDSKTYVFFLRRGVKYHNGREMKAADVKWSFERIIGFGGKSKWASYLADVASVEPLDDYRVRVNLKNPSAPFLSSIRYAAILPPEEEKNLATHPVGTGPFRFVERVPNVHVKVARFGDYWRKGLKYVDEVTLSPVPEAQTAVANLQAAVLDLHYNVPPKFKAELSRLPNVRLYEPMPFATNYMLMLIRHAPPLDNVKVRQALALCTNRELIHRAAMFSVGEPGCSPFPKAHWAHSADVACLPSDRTKAKQLLKEAGYGDGLELTLKASPQYPEFVRTAEIYENQCREIGMRIKIEAIEWATYIKDLYGENKFQLGESSVVREFDPDALTSGVFGTKASGNPGLYSNPRMDELLRMGRAELNRDKRKAIYKEITQLAITDVPAIRQQTWPVLWGATNKVKNLYINALGRPNLLEIELG